MNEYILTEFSIFYKRLTIVELVLKNRIIEKYAETYGENAYNVIYRYIKTLQGNRPPKDNTFIKIHESKTLAIEKLNLAVSKMYISELLNLFANSVFLKNKKVKNNFFIEKVETNTTNFQQKCKILKDFRNCIAHCNTKKYQLDRNKFIKGLVYFEKILNCNVILSCDLIDKINKSRKLSVSEILIYIYNVDKKYFKDDKLLIQLFDDIALINGYTFEGLPQRKSIIREYFRILEKSKKTEEIYSTTFATNNQQMSLFYNNSIIE